MAHQLTVGETVLCYHRDGYYPARVLKADTERWRVHYLGWNSRHDEWVLRDRFKLNSSPNTDAKIRSAADSKAVAIIVESPEIAKSTKSKSTSNKIVDESSRIVKSTKSKQKLNNVEKKNNLKPRYRVDSSSSPVGHGSSSRSDIADSGPSQAKKKKLSSPSVNGLKTKSSRSRAKKRRLKLLSQSKKRSKDNQRLKEQIQQEDDSRDLIYETSVSTPSQLDADNRPLDESGSFAEIDAHSETSSERPPSKLGAASSSSPTNVEEHAPKRERKKSAKMREVERTLAVVQTMKEKRRSAVELSRGSRPTKPPPLLRESECAELRADLDTIFSQIEAPFGGQSELTEPRQRLKFEQEEPFLTIDANSIQSANQHIDHIIVSPVQRTENRDEVIPKYFWTGWTYRPSEPPLYPPVGIEDIAACCETVCLSVAGLEPVPPRLVSRMEVDTTKDFIRRAKLILSPKRASTDTCAVVRSGVSERVIRSPIRFEDEVMEEPRAGRKRSITHAESQPGTSLQADMIARSPRLETKKKTSLQNLSETDKWKKRTIKKTKMTSTEQRCSEGRQKHTTGYDLWVREEKVMRRNKGLTLPTDAVLHEQWLALCTRERCKYSQRALKVRRDANSSLTDRLEHAAANLVSLGDRLTRIGKDIQEGERMSTVNHVDLVFDGFVGAIEPILRLTHDQLVHVRDTAASD